MSPLGRILILLAVVGTAMLCKRLNETFWALPAPALPLDQWWGDGERPSDWEAYVANTSAIISNRLVYPDSSVEDVKTQLGRRLRLTEPLEGTNLEYGFNGKALQEVVDYWRDDYMPRWREREVFLWQFNHFTTNIQGLRTHFFHLMAYDDDKEGKQNYPVLLLHGWPGSVREFFALIHKLHPSNPDEGASNKYIFNVVAPSLPGFAWSQGASRPGLGPAQIAFMMHNLMERLGYKKYFVEGGDWGASIGSHMATLFPDNVLGFHSNSCSNLSPKALMKRTIASWCPSFFVPQGYEDFFFPPSAKFRYLLEESGYFHLQATKPDTIGAALTDNPVGLAAYILEKFSSWTNKKYRHLPDGGLRKRFQMDALLDNLMIYHMTNSITTSQRIYAESFSERHLHLKLDRVPTTVPTGCARFKHDFLHATDFELEDKYQNLLHSTYYDEGGHFAALEMPNTLYHDFIEFVEKVEKFSHLKGY